MMRLFHILFVAVGLLLCVAACQPQPLELTILAQDNLRFSPARLDVTAGREISLTVENPGALDHSWVLVPVDTQLGMAGTVPPVAEADTGIIAGGEQVTIQFTAPATPGAYLYVCTVPGHATAGQVGTFTVTAP